MRINNEHTFIPDTLPSDVHDILSTDPFLRSVKIDAVAPITGGVAHRVYRIESSQENYYIKIRGDHFIEVPSIICNPADIANEYHAIKMFQSAAPEYFPKVLSFDKDRYYLILSDVIKDGEKLEQVLAYGRDPDGLFNLYGKSLKSIQKNTAHIGESIRPEGDETYYHIVLGHRFGYRNHSVLNAAVETLSNLPGRQLIMGDPAPKNMGITHNRQRLTFFDLETAHLGNPEFDYSYGLAHCMLHTIPDTEAMQRAVQDFLIGYGEVSYNPRLIYQLSLGIVLYRLHSVIPYPIALSSEEKIILEAHIEHELFTITGEETWHDIVTKLTNI